MGARYFARTVKDPRDYFAVMEYIDQNPVKAGLAASVGEWKTSGAYYIRHNLSGLVDYTGLTRLSYIRLLPAPLGGIDLNTRLAMPYDGQYNIRYGRRIYLQAYRLQTWYLGSGYL
jgi:hypothetical protein